MSRSGSAGNSGLGGGSSGVGGGSSGSSNGSGGLGNPGAGGSSPDGSTASGGIGGSGATGGTGGQISIIPLDGSTGAIGSCGTNFTGIVRDFIEDGKPGGHPDFEAAYLQGRYDTPTTGIVQDQLGADKKPVYAWPGAAYRCMGDVACASSQQQIVYSPASFDQWYRNDLQAGATWSAPQWIEYTLQVDTLPDNKVVYSRLYSQKNGFFPIDGQLNGNTACDNTACHNYGFTFELHTTFVYQPGQVFTFFGDDDLWVFMNGHLAVDLGGLHPPATGSVSLDAVAAAFGLVPGGEYPMDLFNAERNKFGSTFYMETTIQFSNCEPILIY
ncbi:MAG TPA: fibro-slime domain-containing protein [Polyangiaceae bacterium]